MTKRKFKEEISRLKKVNAHYKAHVESFFDTMQYQNRILSRINEITKDPDIKLLLKDYDW